MHRSRSVPSLALLFVLPIVAACTTREPGRHVSTSGKDTGDCLAAPCATIGYAVRQASPGDTISVDSGTYHESLMVTKRLALIGHHATIDAAGLASPPNGVQISGGGAAGTLVSGFTIENAGLEGIFALRTSKVVIENNTLFHNDAYGKSDSLCTKHQDDCGEAIHLQTVSGAVVRGNTVHNNLGGILLTDETGPTRDNLISDNTIGDNPSDCGITLASHWVDSSKVATAEVAGIYRNTVTRNTVSGSGGAGIGIFAAGPGGAAWGNIVDGNTVTKNGLAGLAIHSHAKFQNVDGNVFRNNTVSGNATDAMNPADHQPAGISIYSSVVPIRNTVVTGNTISDEKVGIISQNVDPLTDLGSNTFAPSVAVKTQAH